ncbi:hypothetical protein [Acidithiobacillus caldus]|nr:hypothetical protein [Acidithiobacillus caldus]
MKSYPANFGQLAYNPDNKKRFLDESAKLLRAVAKAFPGMTGKVSKNPAGIAVGGDVYLDLEQADRTHGVLVTITHSAFGGRQPDGVLCYAQHRLPDQRGQLTRCPVNAPNRYSDLSLSAISSLVSKMLTEAIQ